MKEEREIDTETPRIHAFVINYTYYGSSFIADMTRSHLLTRNKQLEKKIKLSIKWRAGGE